MHRSLMLPLLLGASVGATAATPAALPTLTELRPVTLHPGVNVVPGFLPDGSAATIVEAWRGNGNAHGHHAWMVLTGPSEGNPIGLATVDMGTSDRDTIADNPFDGERVLGAVRFVRARLAGKLASLLVTATLDDADGRPLADHQLAMVTIYRLTANDGGIGSPIAFVRVASGRSSKRYCNAELALRDMLGVPLPADYSGANTVDGCVSP